MSTVTLDKNRVLIYPRNNSALYFCIQGISLTIQDCLNTRAILKALNEQRINYETAPHSFTMS